MQARAKKKSNLERNFAGALPNLQFNKRVSASLLSAHLTSLLHYMVLQKKKPKTTQTSTFIKVVMNGSLRLWSPTPVLLRSPKGRSIRRTLFFLSFQIVLSDCTFEPDFVKI